ncbi:uncharacterized protein LOC143852890 isoform X2 [Tasmannia lanceolata]|uniref:uncharacterized protein LOC143852890 isoform X2 n=1 Tax=Tasmannia lanceolata TaxID=3420 RepID=UPI004063E98E
MVTALSSSLFISPTPFPRTLWLSSSPPAHISVSCYRTRSSQPSTLSKTLTQIKESGVIACLRAQSGEQAMEAAQAALKGGISVLEIVMSTPGVFEVIQGLVCDHPTLTIGEILDDVQGGEVLYIPGVMTPTEVLNAYNAGARIVKVYPVSALGGAQYISTLKKPFSHIPMVASQGITIDSIGAYITQGASAVVLSDAIFDKEAMRQSNFDRIYQLAHLATLHGMEAVKRKNKETRSLSE